jgi:putative endonuclease
LTGLTEYHAGRVAEDIAARDYTDRARVFAAKRWRSTVGEIDLIMRNSTQVVFGEVKKSGSFARAATPLPRRQMDRVGAAGAEFLASAPMGQLTDVRFDLALVNGIGDVQIIENAFDAG